MCICYSKEFESSEWKDCISHPSLPYVLKILTGLAQHHTQTQVAVDHLSVLHAYSYSYIFNGYIKYVHSSV